MEVTRKNYLELWLNNEPAVASGRSSNRHTSLVEAIEHAEEHAVEIGEPGLYEVRVDGGLFYTVNIRNVTLTVDIEYMPSPEPQARLFLDDTEYAGFENTEITFNILRDTRVDQTVEVDWAITNASVTPTSGTVRFQAARRPNIGAKRPPREAKASSQDGGR